MTQATGAGTRLAVVIVNFASHQLLEALGPLSAAEVVLVDSFSSPQEQVAAAALAERAGWQFVPLPDNPGFGAAANAGARRAAELDCEVLVFLNPDAQVDADVLRALHRAAADDRRALVTPTLVTSSGQTYFADSFLDLDRGRIRRQAPAGVRVTEWVTATCLAVSGEFFAELGGFDPDYFMYWEDVDLSVRAIRAGGRLVVRPDLTAVHDPGGTQQQSRREESSGRAPSRARSSLYYYYSCRNRLLFAGRHPKLVPLWRWLVRTPAECLQVYLIGGRRQFLSKPWGFLPVVAGGLAGGYRSLAERWRRRPGRR